MLTKPCHPVRLGVIVLAFLFAPFFVGQAAASYRDLDCSDFGTRERAQYEFNQMDSDIYGLDRDGDESV